MAVIVAVTALVCAPVAGAGTIGRANVDGSRVNQSFIPRPGSDPPYLVLPWTIAVDGTHVYWTEVLDGGIQPPLGIRRAALNGSRAETIVGGDAEDLGPLGGLAIGAGHLYWTSALGISRANLDGSAVELGFLGDQIGGYDLAVAGGHIYWTSLHAIGRASLDGSNLEPALVAVPRTLPTSLAVDDHYLYWTWHADRGSCGGGQRPCRPPEFSIARARLDGSAVDRHFIPDLPVLAWGYVQGIAVDNRHIYWTDGGGGHIGRAGIDGTHIEEAFIRNASGPTDVAVAGGHLYWTNPQQRLLSILGSRLTLRRDRRTSVKLACPTLFSLPSEPSPPCVGTLRLLTAKPVRYLGDKRRVTLATARYTITKRKRQTLSLRLSERKAALVRSNPRTRRVRAVAEVERTPGDRAIVSEPMTMILAH